MVQEPSSELNSDGQSSRPFNARKLHSSSVTGEYKSLSELLSESWNGNRLYKIKINNKE